MPEWDIELFRSQARAGLQWWYILFLSELDTTEGLMGPYPSEEAAKLVMDAFLAVDQLAIDYLDTDSPYARYFAPWHHCQVVQLTPHELEIMT